MYQNPRYVKWSHVNQDGFVGKDWMLRSEVQNKIQEFEQAAKKILEDTGADHVLYAIKYFDDNCTLEEVKFYELPMTDEEFEDRVARQVRVQVYALHKHR